ncbi:MAG: 3-phosphoshikimate 1-carboxyvinyltransferase [Rubrobacteraceae bacterium]|jgi:3-phosphoshikimate 1-carboxyvinyltransferase|nr:3-phosphoshikimate 1-carboxyvinyltransferase [Rubrobacteraceae bacterium]
MGVPGVDFTVGDIRPTFPEELEVTPLERPPDAKIRVPGSKSLTNRALIIAALAEGHSRILNPLFSDDSYWLMNALVRLGIDVSADGERGEVYVSGQSGGIDASGVDLFVGNAGTVARFLPPVLALGRGPYTIDGVPRMRERPVADLVDAMRHLGAAVDYAGEPGRFPLAIEGGGFRGGEVRVSASKSSQFVSGLLMASPYADAPVTLHPEGRKEWPYVGITVALMRAFGVEVDEANGRFTVAPALYSSREYEVEPDASGASYFMAAAAVTGGRVRIPGLGSSSPQGDLRFAGVLRDMGCRVEIAPHSIEVKGPDRLQGIEVDMNAFSDTMITLAAISPFATSPTTIKNVGHTRLQETDRLSAVATELNRLGVKTHTTASTIRIIPDIVRPGVIRTYGDHRMAMAFAITGLVASGIRIGDPGCVAKTFPGYFGALESLR